MPDAVLVTGAGGFIGVHLVRALTACGTRVIAASRNAFDSPAGVQRHVGELREPEDFTPLLIGCRAVVHLASTSTPGSTAGDPLAELDTNLYATLALLRALQTRPDIQLLFVSSGGNLYPPGQTAAVENTATLPRSYHGAGKASAEQFIAAWCAQYGAHASILRPSNVYGPGQKERHGFAVIPTAMRCLLRREQLTIWGDGSALRDYLYIDDFIALCLATINRPDGSGYEIFNASSGHSISLNDLLAMIEAVAGHVLQRKYAAQRAVDLPRVALDHNAASHQFAWSPAVDLHEGLKRTWAWFKSYQI